MNIYGFAAEVAWLVVNCLLGIAGAMFGMSMGRTITEQNIRGRDILLSVSIGLALGLIGFIGLYYGLSTSPIPL